MKPYISVLLVLLPMSGVAQVLIHAHNDYEKPIPLYNAISNRADIIEADVFPKDSQLLVAHSRDKLPSAKTLKSSYIDPIVALFKKNRGHVSDDSSYRFILMIDVKQMPVQSLQNLIRSVEPFRNYFDRTINPNAIQLVISGDRGEVSKWDSYPAYIFFDGRPYEKYSATQLSKVMMISDDFFHYASRQSPRDIKKLKPVIDSVHAKGKPVRFWGYPDQRDFWELMLKEGVDVINTDHVAECKEFIREKMH